MKIRNLVVAIAVTCISSGCLNSQYDYYFDRPRPVLEESEIYWSELELAAGHLSLSGKIEKIDPRISVSWAEGIEYAQIIGEVTLDEGQDPDFLRVIFSSDRVEWVGTDGLDYEAYEYEDDCLEEGYHCDPVIPAEGVSGVFETTHGNYSAVVNTHCSTALTDYEYRVSAYVIDFSGKGLVRVSDTATIDIICEQI
tara:strand:- start:37 stop:624 length:588 start_codon:yes stop_codon:yes gene_type:complete